MNQNSQDIVISETHGILDADASKIIRNAKEGYPEGREPRELTLAERVKALCIYAADWKRWFEESQKSEERLRQALKEIASQHTTKEMDKGAYEMSDFEAGYDACIQHARDAIKPAENPT